jgi:uncharacterized membrane protein YheB (UPF0754 family)
VTGAYINLKKKISQHILKFKRKKKNRKIIRKLKHYNWMICYFKKNKQTQWRYGYNNIRLTLLLEKFWYPMKTNYIKFSNNINYQNESPKFKIIVNANELIQDIWVDPIDINDFIKKI